MALTVEQAKTLQPGDFLSFGTDRVYQVIAVVPHGAGVRLVLLRDDGVETHAHTHDLDMAERMFAERTGGDDTGTLSPVDAPVEAEQDVTVELPETTRRKAKGK